jgi:integrase
LAQVALGQDPAGELAKRRTEPTISAIADRYLAEHVAVHNKASTAAEARRIVEKRIKPELGHLRVSEVARSLVKSWHQTMHDTPYEANRALGYFSKLMSLAAVEWELRPDNPCRGVKRFPEAKRERFFSDDELKRIGAELSKAERAQTYLPGCINAIRLLAVTGCRLGEVLSLRWGDIDLQGGVIRLRDAKTGARTVPLGAPALALLAGMQRASDFVVHGPDPSKPLSGSTFRDAWNRLRVSAGVPDGRPHDFRHTAGTYAAQSGANAFLVRDLLGHRTLAMTGRYVERAADPLRATADAFSSRIAAAMNAKPEEGAEVVPLKRTSRLPSARLG